MKRKVYRFKGVGWGKDHHVSGRKGHLYLSPRAHILQFKEEKGRRVFMYRYFEKWCSGVLIPDPHEYGMFSSASGAYRTPPVIK